MCRMSLLQTDFSIYSKMLEDARDVFERGEADVTEDASFRFLEANEKLREGKRKKQDKEEATEQLKRALSVKTRSDRATVDMVNLIEAIELAREKGVLAAQIEVASDFKEKQLELAESFVKIVTEYNEARAKAESLITFEIAISEFDRLNEVALTRQALDAKMDSVRQLAESQWWPKAVEHLGMSGIYK